LRAVAAFAGDGRSSRRVETAFRHPMKNDGSRMTAMMSAPTTMTWKITRDDHASAVKPKPSRELVL
jgi:hypothetical protein